MVIDGAALILGAVRHFSIKPNGGKWSATFVIVA